MDAARKAVLATLAGSSIGVLAPHILDEQVGDTIASMPQMASISCRGCRGHLQRCPIYACLLSSCSSSRAGAQVITPPEWRQRYGVEHGAAFGLSHGLDQLAVFRPSIRDPAVRGSVLSCAPAVVKRMHSWPGGLFSASILAVPVVLLHRQRWHGLVMLQAIPCGRLNQAWQRRAAVHDIGGIGGCTD